MRKAILLLASCAVLAGCGGDGGGSGGGSVAVVGTTPTPIPTPTPSPTPAPTSGALNTGEVKPAADATFISATMELTTTGGSSETNGVITGGTTTNRSTTLDTPQFMGSYSAATGYHLADAANAVVFGPAQLTADTTERNGNGTVLFTNASGSGEDYLALYQATTYTSSIKGSGYTTARYGGIGGWQHTIVDGSSRHTRLDYFAFGSATPVSAMPRSGVVKFTVIGSGNYATDTDLWFLTGSDYITVDFGAGTVSGSVSISGQNFYKSQVGGVGSLPISGTFSGNSLTGPIVNGSLNTSGAVPGRFRLLFVGPNANEIIVTYVASDGAQAAVGAAVGIVDPNLN